MIGAGARRDPRVCAADEAALRRAARLLCDGELVAFATETVYGLGADAANPQAVARIFAAKGRPNDHPVIVHLLPEADLAVWAADVPPPAQRLIQAFWPGPLTLILRRAPGVPDAVTGGQDTVGLRSPAHPVAQALLRAFADAGGSGALAAPSANRFGRISPTTAEHVAAEFGPQVPLILDGGMSAVGVESTIVDLSRGRAVLLRPGGITVGELVRVLGEPVWLPDGRRADAALDAGPLSASVREADTPRVSGALSAHYAPRTPMRLVPASVLPAQVHALAALGQRIGVWAAQRPAGAAAWRAAPREPAAYAHELYAALRALDAAGVDLILVQTPPMGDAWLAAHDRLGRAEVGSGASEGT
ncbi:threonylcarbamoyl-AMP synthase [Verticiella sediminum]|uniref:Threonylcarbamoyl-AMP synthase n=1 Tax=Verticiella sediminum TaxID=1247510 RepID=A0A556AVZ1_9BURK|nr:L-threonylcarbamoyladenylate synthase [Verticiella sediminum]TSH97080.1 threonylcarbamoyl-AMP synthase [Verticiella sediminum]